MKPTGAIFGLLLGAAGVSVAFALRADGEPYWFVPLILIVFVLLIALRNPQPETKSRHGSRFDDRTAGTDVCDSSESCGDGGGD